VKKSLIKNLQKAPKKEEYFELPSIFHSDGHSKEKLLKIFETNQSIFFVA